MCGVTTQDESGLTTGPSFRCILECAIFWTPHTNGVIARSGLRHVDERVISTGWVVQWYRYIVAHGTLLVMYGTS